MSYTRAQLINKALGKLSILVEGQAASSGDVLKMDGVVNAAMATLAALDIYYVADFGELGPNGGAIEDEAFLPLATMLGRFACEEFNMAADEKMVVESQLAEAMLRVIARPPRSRTRLGIEAGARSGRRGVVGLWPNNG